MDHRLPTPDVEENYTALKINELQLYLQPCEWFLQRWHWAKEKHKYAHIYKSYIENHKQNLQKYTSIHIKQAQWHHRI